MPYASSIWLALAKLETYKNAKKVLNNAIKHNPSDFTIWMAAAKLEEAEGNTENVSKLIQTALSQLEKRIKVSRDQWLKEAFESELAGSKITCRAIIKETLYVDIDDKQDIDECWATWEANIDTFTDRGAFECAKALIYNVLSKVQTEVKIWKKAI